MKHAPSLRSRVMAGAVFWTIGLFLVAGAVMVHLIESNPNAPQAFHHFFLSVSPISVLAIVFLFLGLTQIRRGVSPIAQLRHRLSGVHKGHARRIDGRFPSEVQPLVDDLNTLLVERDTAIERAQSKAGDLAHGLKTPLAVLLQEADVADQSGRSDLGDAIRQQVERMQRQMDYHLARTRAVASSASAGTRCDLSSAADGLVRTLRRLHADRQLTFSVSIPEGTVVRTERIDVEEMLGNLLDNACKWASTTVTLTARRDDRHIVMTVDDDGDGVDEAMLERIVQRGVRVDESAPGSGFGLAIVRDVADAYGGTLALGRSALGGLTATLTLPAA